MWDSGRYDTTRRGPAVMASLCKTLDFAVHTALS